MQKQLDEIAASKAKGKLLRKALIDAADERFLKLSRQAQESIGLF